MRDYFNNTSEVLDRYNSLLNSISTSLEETTDDEDEFLINFSLYLAHALVKDYGTGGASRSELLRMAKIIIDLIDE